MGTGATGLSNWKLVLRLGRVSNLPTVWSNLLAGLVLAGGARAGAGVDVYTLLILTPAVSLIYVSGMFLNDAFDRDNDAALRPDRPIPSGQVSAAHVFIAGYVQMAAGLALLAFLGVQALVSAVVLCGFILLYDIHHKNNPASPILMGMCRTLVYILASIAGGAMVIAIPMLALFYVAGLTYAAKRENLLEFGNAWPLLMFALPLIWVAANANFSSAPFLLVFLGWTGYALRMLLFRNALDIRRAVGALIAGISLFDAVLIAEAGRTDLAVAAVAAFALTLMLHKHVPGT